jgi:hypothetical protein
MCLRPTLTTVNSRLNYLPLGMALIKNYVRLHVGRNLKISALPYEAEAPLKKRQTHQEIPGYTVYFLN